MKAYCQCIVRLLSNLGPELGAHRGQPTQGWWSPCFWKVWHMCASLYGGHPIMVLGMLCMVAQNTRQVSPSSWSARFSEYDTAWALLLHCSASTYRMRVAKPTTNMDVSVAVGLEQVGPRKLSNFNRAMIFRLTPGECPELEAFDTTSLDTNWTLLAVSKLSIFISLGHQAL